MFQGSMVALVTPMHEDGSVDYPSLQKLIDFHVEQGTDAIVSVGTTGEASTLGFDEHCEVIRETVRMVRGRVPVIGGTGANATNEAIELTRGAMEAGVDACLLVNPYYIKPTQEGLYRHHRAVAEAVPVPQIIYNVPGRTACDMRPETVQRLSETRNIIGVKEATGDIARVHDIRDRCGDGFEIYSGDDATAMEAILAGARGDISVTANVAPQLMHEMCMAALAGERELAEDLNARLEPLHRGLFVESSPIPVKWALHIMGLIGPGIRLPLTLLSEDCHDIVLEALRHAGVQVNV